MENFDVLQSQLRCQHVIDAAGAAVEICMQVHCRNAVFNQIQKAISGVGVAVYLLDALKQQRMVRHDQLAAARLCLLEHVRHRVECDEDFMNLSVKMPARKPYVVPVQLHIGGGKVK